MDQLNIAVIPGDGVGLEVVPEGIQVLQAASELHGGLQFNFHEFSWGCRYYQTHGRMMPEDGIEILGQFDAIVLGAVGDPSVPDHISLWGLLIPIRREFEQYVNLRPIHLLRGIRSPLDLSPERRIDFTVIRENSEGEYSNMGGRIHEGSSHAAAIQVNYFSKIGIERVGHYAFDLAFQQGGSVTIATKSNGIVHSMPFWDETILEVAAQYPSVEYEFALIDALCAYIVTKPEEFDVIVASNLFGDILTDLGAAVVGSIGIAPSANLNPERRFPSMFEPVHGSAPTIAGKNVANPIGAIWSVKLLLDFFGASDIGSEVLSAVEEVIESGLRTADLGGRTTTQEFGKAVRRSILRGVGAATHGDS